MYLHMLITVIDKDEKFTGIATELILICMMFFCLFDNYLGEKDNVLTDPLGVKTYIAVATSSCNSTKKWKHYDLKHLSITY